jgi:hypothetical protein
VVFSVLVLHWVTHQDDDDLASSSNKPSVYTINSPSHSANPFSGRFGFGNRANSQHGGTDKGFGGHVVTNCEAQPSDANDVPLHGIVRKTAVTRTTEAKKSSEEQLQSRSSSEAQLCPSTEADSSDKSAKGAVTSKI